MGDLVKITDLHSFLFYKTSLFYDRQDKHLMLHLYIKDKLKCSFPIKLETLLDEEPVTQSEFLIQSCIQQYIEE